MDRITLGRKIDRIVLGVIIDKKYLGAIDLEPIISEVEVSLVVNTGFTVTATVDPRGTVTPVS